MRYWYDTEFLQVDNTLDLISIGIVAEDGREYYAINVDAPWVQIGAHQWLMENVMPLLAGEEEALKPVDEIRCEVAAFLLRAGTPELWAYFAAFDHVMLTQLFKGITNYPKVMPAWTNDIRQWQYQLGVRWLPRQGAGMVHHALADARQNQLMWNWLASRAMGQAWGEGGGESG